MKRQNMVAHMPKCRIRTHRVIRAIPVHAVWIRVATTGLEGCKDAEGRQALQAPRAPVVRRQELRVRKAPQGTQDPLALPVPPVLPVPLVLPA